MTTDIRCGKSWGGLRTEHCPVCHETFSGTIAGDKHRTGAHGVDRRCRTPDEMRERGMQQNARGVWTSGGSYWTQPNALGHQGGDCMDGDVPGVDCGCEAA